MKKTLLDNAGLLLIEKAKTDIVFNPESLRIFLVDKDTSENLKKIDKSYSVEPETMKEIQEKILKNSPPQSPLGIFTISPPWNGIFEMPQDILVFRQSMKHLLDKAGDVLELVVVLRIHSKKDIHNLEEIKESILDFSFEKDVEILIGIDTCPEVLEEIDIQNFDHIILNMGNTLVSSFENIPTSFRFTHSTEVSTLKKILSNDNTYVYLPLDISLKLWNKIKQWRIEKIMRIDKYLTILNSLISKLRFEYPQCGAGTRMLTFDQDGNVYPCPFMRTPEFSVRPIDKNILKVSQNEKCSRCWLRSICGGLCLSSEREDNCEIIRELALNIIESYPRLVSDLKTSLKKNQISEMTHILSNLKNCYYFSWCKGV